MSAEVRSPLSHKRSTLVAGRVCKRISLTAPVVTLYRAHLQSLSRVATARQLPRAPLTCRMTGEYASEAQSDRAAPS